VGGTLWITKRTEAATSPGPPHLQTREEKQTKKEGKIQKAKDSRENAIQIQKRKKNRETSGGNKSGRSINCRGDEGKPEKRTHQAPRKEKVPGTQKKVSYQKRKKNDRQLKPGGVKGARGGGIGGGMTKGLQGKSTWGGSQSRTPPTKQKNTEEVTKKRYDLKGPVLVEGEKIGKAVFPHGRTRIVKGGGSLVSLTAKIEVL